jgi:hypothetical protein
MDIGKETIITKGCKRLLDAFQLLASVVVIEFQTAEAYSSSYLTKVKYNVCRQSREENEKVKVRTSPNNVIYCENM